MPAFVCAGGAHLAEYRHDDLNVGECWRDSPALPRKCSLSLFAPSWREALGISMFIRYFAAPRAVRLLFAAVATLAFSAAAEAQYLTYVAANGNDANPCTVMTAPCKTLQRAINAAPANGEVRVLTPLTSNGFINKNIIISGDGTPIVGAIIINSASARVTLRGLAMNGVDGFLHAIDIESAAAVHIEDCIVERYDGFGISLSATTATSLFIADTVVGESGGGLIVLAANAKLEIQNSRFEKNSGDGLYLQAAETNITRTLVSGNSNDGIVLRSGNANVTETTVADSVRGFWIIGAFTTLTSSVARGNSTGLKVEIFNSAIVSNSVFTFNNTGINNEGTLYSRQNNTNNGNGDDYAGTAPVVAPAL